MIFHVDMDAFFVSVERLHRPELKGIPVVIGGTPESRGVVAAASYEARRFGIHSAQPMSAALRRCPNAVRISPDHKSYVIYSKKVDSLLERFTPVIQKVSVDESYLDMGGTERLWGRGEEAAFRLQQTIKEELDLPCSVGGGANKLIAKIASGQAKPAGILIVEIGKEQLFLDPLTVDVIPGAGKVVQQALANMGIMTIGDLRSVPEDELVRRFGRHGIELAARARGEGSTLFPEREPPKSVSRETTFARDVEDKNELAGALSGLLDRAAAALRKEKMSAGGIAVKVRYGDFSTKTRSESLPTPTTVDVELMPVARRLLKELIETRSEPVRLIGVRLEKLVTDEQLGLFSDGTRRWEHALDKVDRLRDRYGSGSLRWGRELTAKTGERRLDDQVTTEKRHKELE